MKAFVRLSLKKYITLLKIYNLNFGLIKAASKLETHVVHFIWAQDIAVAKIAMNELEPEPNKYDKMLVVSIMYIPQRLVLLP